MMPGWHLPQLMDLQSQGCTEDHSPPSREQTAISSDLLDHNDVRGGNPSKSWDTATETLDHDSPASI